MARKQVGLKFEEGDLDRWDAWASQHGYSRTTMIETALEALTSGKQVVIKQARSPKSKAESQASEEVPLPKIAKKWWS